MNNFLQKIVVVFLMLFTSLSVYSQEKQEGVHHLQAEEMRKDMPYISAKKNNTVPIIPLSVNATKGLNKVVFGFLPDWEYGRGAHNNMRYELLSHVAVFDFTIQSDGSLNNPSGWPWTDVINGAHAKGTKVIMSVSNFEISDATLSTILRGTTEKNNFFKNLKSIISTYNLDGVNIDFEAFNTADRGSVLNSFMSDLTNYIHTELPGKEVSFDGPAVNWSGWDFEGLVDAVDHLFIMAYDYNQNKGKVADPVSPLYPGSWSKCIDVTVTSYSTGYAAAVSKSPEKIILGVPYYGQKWQTVNGDLYADVVTRISSTRYKDDFAKFNIYGRQWDTKSHTSWYKFQSSGKWYEVYSDDAGSLGEKYDYTIAKNLGGIGIWALNYDGTRGELWDLISDKFYTNSGTCNMTATSTPDYFVRYVQVMDEAKENALITNETGEDSGYGDYKSQSIDVVAGVNYQAMIRGKLYGTAQTYWKILIDIDKDGAFNGLNESILSKDGDAWGYHLFTIPSSIPTGAYTFRVVMSSQPLTNLCGSFTGEIEDYTVNIINNNLGLENDNSEVIISIYPNPSQGLINVKADGGVSINSVEVFNTHSQIVFSSMGDLKIIDISSQIKGIYFVKVVLDNGSTKVFKIVKR